MDITRQLRGKQVAAVICNGELLVIQCADRSELRIRWVDDNGETLKGKPVLEGRGLRLQAEGMQELIHLPRSA